MLTSGCFKVSSGTVRCKFEEVSGEVKKKLRQDCIFISFEEVAIKVVLSSKNQIAEHSVLSCFSLKIAFGLYYCFVFHKSILWIVSCKCGSG